MWILPKAKMWLVHILIQCHQFQAEIESICAPIGLKVNIDYLNPNPIWACFICELLRHCVRNFLLRAGMKLMKMRHWSKNIVEVWNFSYLVPALSGTYCVCSALFPIWKIDERSTKRQNKFRSFFFRYYCCCCGHAEYQLCMYIP